MIGGDRPRLEPPVPSTWLASLLRPAPDSAVADTLRRGKSPWSEAVHLLWSVWIFLTPLLGHGFTLRWLLLTLASYPVFLLLYAKVMVAPRHHAPRYALGLIAMSLVLLPWYPSGLTYFVFGCVLLRVSGRGGWWQYLLQLTGLNLLFCSLALLFQYPWQSLVWIPAVAYIVGLVVNVEALNQQKDAALQLSQDEVRRLAATAERERIGRDLHDLLERAFGRAQIAALQPQIGVDDPDTGQVGEMISLRHQLRADDDVDVARGQALQCRPPGSLLLAAGQQLLATMPGATPNPFV